MRKINLLIFISFFLLTTISIAGNGFKVNFKQTKSSSSELSFNLENYNIAETTINGVTYSKLQFDVSAKTNKKGYAELPYIHASVQLIENKNVSLKITDSKYVDYQLDHPLLPSRGTIYRDQDPSKIPFIIDNNSIVDAWYPENIATSSDPFILRDIRGTNIYVYPFQYNAAKNILRVYTEVSVKLINNDTDVINPLPQKHNEITADMSGIYQSMFVNYNPSKSLSLNEMGDILVIYTERDKDAIQPYIEWKKIKGFTVHEEIVETGTNVKSTIQEAYEQNNEILYVQLVGDWEDIKCDLIGGKYNAPMDPMLGCVVGDDYFTDLIIGRFSSKRAFDVETQVAKTIKYEKEPDFTGDWYSKATVIASKDGGESADDGETDRAHIDNIRTQKLEPFGYNPVYHNYATDFMVDNKVNHSAMATLINTQINDGVGLINYAGHGSNSQFVTSEFNNLYVSSLTNGDKLPFICSVACVNGEFHYEDDDCFAEYWLKNPSGGAVATLMSSINQPWNPPMAGQDYFNDILIGGYDYLPGNGINVTDQRTTFGSVAFNATNLTYAEYNNYDALIAIQTWTIFGDASLQIRTKTPIDLKVSHESTISIGSAQATINCEEEGALVALSINGELIGKGYSNGTNAIIDFLTLTEIDTIDVTVTAYNGDTYIGEIEIINNNDAIVNFLDYALDDTNGNNNGKADFGENIILNIDVKNFGALDANTVTSKIVCSDTYITLTDSTFDFGSVTAGDTATGTFGISIADNTPNKHKVPFTMEITDETETWSAIFYITINAPILEVEFVNIDDSEQEDEDGFLDPGETANLNFNIINTGSATSLDASCTLTSNSSYVTINNPTIALGTLTESYSDISAFEITIDDATPKGSIIDFTTVLSAGEYSDTLTFDLPVGIEFETWESEDFLTFNWETEGVNNRVWRIETENVYNGKFSAKSGLFTTSNDKGTSTLSITVNVTEDSKISFYKMTSCEDAGGDYYWDHLEFKIDEISKAKWDGVKMWTYEEFDVTAGEHTFSWTYNKDAIGTAGDDCAYLDDIALPIHDKATIINSVQKEVSNLDYNIYPNPVNSNATINYQLPEASNVKISIVNLLGEEVNVIANKEMQEGVYNLNFNSSNYEAGIYFCKFVVNDLSFSKKIIITK